MIVRRCKTDDFPQIEVLIEEFMQEALKDFGAKIEKQALNKLMQELYLSSLVLENGNGNVIGILAGKIITEPTGNSKIFQEVVWYVAKAHRKYGLLLIRAMENRLKNEGISAMIMVHISNSMPEKVARLYERMGYKHMECHYLKRI